MYSRNPSWTPASQIRLLFILFRTLASATFNAATYSRVRLLLMVIATTSTHAQLAAATLDEVHKPLETFLQHFVRREQRVAPGGTYTRTSVKYEILKRNPKWKAYIETLPYVDPSRIKTASRDGKLSFWINTYNVFVIDAIINNYPLKPAPGSIYPPESYRGSIAWETKHFVAGREMTLESIYEEILKINEPRAILALCQGAFSSPPLLRVYTGRNLSGQLNDTARSYINDPMILRLERTRRELILGGVIPDLAPLLIRANTPTPTAVAEHPVKYRALIAFLLAYLPPERQQYVLNPKINVVITPPDYRLNEAE